MNRTTYIDAGKHDFSRPKERPVKKNWKVDLLIKGLGVLQHISPRAATEIVWHHFTKPGRSKFTDNQQALIAKAEVKTISYLGYEIVTYKWGNKGPKVLLSHGWNSKVADFRKMIEGLLDAGFVVEGIDMKAHGRSSGKHTALPEMRDILKGHYILNGPYHALIGYSIGGLAAGIMLNEISPDFQPKYLFLIAAPSHTKYFFYDTIKELGFKDEVYKIMCEMVDERYFQPVDYFDLRDKKNKFGKTEIHLIYDEDDQTVAFERGKELKNSFPEASFVQTKGLGHYKIISFSEIIGYVIKNIKNSLTSINTIHSAGML